MGAAVDDDSRKDKNDWLEEGRFPPAVQPVDFSEMSLDALSFMANIPPQYQALVAAVIAQRAEEEKFRAREKRDKEEELDRLLSGMRQTRQQEIDRNLLAFEIGGKEVTISQGDLRRIMQARMEELRERRERLAHEGGNAEEIRRIDRLLGRYEPAVDRLKEREADAGTIAEVKDLAEKDPPFGEHFQVLANDRVHVTAMSGNDRRISYAAAYLDEDAAGSPRLKDQFAKSASSPISNPSATTQPAIEPQQQSQRLNFGAANF